MYINFTHGIIKFYQLIVAFVVFLIGLLVEDILWSKTVSRFNFYEGSKVRVLTLTCAIKTGTIRLVANFSFKSYIYGNINFK